MIGSLLLAWTLIALAPTSGNAQDLYDLHKLVDDSRLTLVRFLKHPNTQQIRKRLAEAKGVLIMPNVTEASYVVGGYSGNGIYLQRDQKSGEWSDPAFYRVSGLSFGLQIGIASSEVVAFVMTKRGADFFLRRSFQLGSGAGLAVGSFGGGVSKAGGLLTSDFITIARSSGAIVTLALGGSTIAVRNSANATYYGEPVTPEDILVDRTISYWYSDRVRKALSRATQDASGDEQS